MRAVILVPRRSDGGPRDQLWAWARQRWEHYHPELPILEGHHDDDGPFNRSMAVNRAARLAGAWDVALVIDSDIFIRRSQVELAIHKAHTTGKVTWPHMRWRGIREDFTTRIVSDGEDFGAEVNRMDMDVLVERTNPISWSCCIAIPRGAWDELGGFDERFIGWGFEDMAFQAAVVGLLGHERLAGDVYHLWHPRSVTTGGRAAKEGGQYTREAITNARLGRRYMVALRRDHGLHDRPDGPMTEEERTRDIANLRRDDEKLAGLATQLGLPDWSSWWPALPELVAGAKDARDSDEPTVTLVVHTDGRRDYIVRSMLSLEAHVSGPIVKRVIYDDSGDPEYKAWLRREFGLGYHVVGPDTRLGYTGSMAAMWRYLQDRCSSELVFAVEDDFVYQADIDLGELAAVLRARPELAQIALLRKPAYPRELELGGILGWDTGSFEPVRQNGYGWLEHRNFWTANPSLFRRSLTRHPWPQASSSERVFGDQLLRDKRVRFAFWGDGQPQIEHIGLERAGTGY